MEYREDMPNTGSDSVHKKTEFKMKRFYFILFYSIYGSVFL